MAKHTFVMYKSWDSAIQSMTDDQAGKLLKAIYDYQLGREKGATDPAVVPILALMSTKFDEDAESYEQVCAARAEAGRKGGTAKASNAKQMLANASSAKQNLASCSKAYQNVPESESESVSVSESVSESVSASASGSLTGTDIGKRKRFQRPTVAEVSEYCDERHNNVDPQRFVDYYDSNGWHVGKNPMKDWKAAVRTWERNSTGNRKPTEQSGREWLMQEVERDE